MGCRDEPHSHVRYHHVDVHLSGQHIVRRVSLSVDGGRFLGVIGPNGSGKSTILRCLYRAIDPSNGCVSLDGRDIGAISMRKNARQVAALTQAADGHQDFTAAEVVRAGRIPHRSPFSLSHTADDARICAEAMRDAGVEHLAERFFGSLSGGEAQRVLIARAFAQRPRVLVLDEPTNHLDVRHQYGVLSTARARGVTVLAALHDLNLAAQFCDELVLVAEGRIVCSGPPVHVLTPELVERWFGINCHIYQHPRLNVPQVIFDEGDVP